MQVIQLYNLAYGYAVQLLDAGYTLDEAGSAACIMHNLDEFQSEDLCIRLNRFFGEKAV